jgi:hypothetical protein
LKYLSVLILSNDTCAYIDRTFGKNGKKYTRCLCAGNLKKFSVRKGVGTFACTYVCMYRYTGRVIVFESPIVVATDVDVINTGVLLLLLQLMMPLLLSLFLL